MSERGSNESIVAMVLQVNIHMLVPVSRKGFLLSLQ